MSLQVKQLDLSVANLSNGALLDGGKIKSESVLLLGTPATTPIYTDAEFDNRYGKYGMIDDYRFWTISTEEHKINYYDKNGTYLGKILFHDRPKIIKYYQPTSEIFVFGDQNISGDFHVCQVFDYETLTLKRNIIPSKSSPDKTLGEVKHIQGGDVYNNVIYVFDYTTGCVQSYDLNGNWLGLIYDSGYPFKHGIVKCLNGWVYLLIADSPVLKRIKINNLDVEDLYTSNDFLNNEPSIGNIMNGHVRKDLFILNNHIFIWNSSVEMAAEFDENFNFIKTHTKLFRKGSNPYIGEYVLDYDTISIGFVPSWRFGISNSYDRYIMRHFATYACVFNIREDQTALWQNQSLGGAGVINQIAIKQSDNGTKNWYIKKSSDNTWQSFEPNKYYSTSLLELSASETFDIKVEMGNFYDPVKEQIEIEKISVLFTPEITLPIVENLQITNETLTVSLAWESNAPMNYHVQEAKATIAEWQTIATTTGTTFTITYTDPEQQQIPHYFRVLGVLNNGYTEPTNVVVAYPSQGGEENIYKYCNNQLLSILKNDSRLAGVQEWLDYPPDKTTVKHKIIGWVTYRGERINNWVALGERELWLSFEIGVLVKESERRNRFNSLTKPERKDYSFLIKEILYELNNRTLNDYIYDMEIYEELPYRRKDYHSISIINVILKKRIRR